MDESGAAHVDTGARVVVFDPSRRAIATYHGALDPETGDVADWVRSVAISLPGTDTTVMDFDDDHAADLYHAAGPSSAVFQWAGGEFPQSFLGSIDPSFAQDLAPRLRDFAGGIPLPADAKLTVLGHSYGAAAIGLAEQAGLQADRILYVSPAGLGAGISGIADFPHTSQVPHYAMMTRNDLVVGPVQGQLGDFNAFHGQSALTATGVTRLETGTLIAADPFSTALEDYDVPGNASPSAIDSHASVFIPGSTAFENMVAVITGGDAQLFAEDRVIQASGRSPSMGGVDLAGFRPIYTSVE
jgi:hypothetical protein